MRIAHDLWAIAQLRCLVRGALIEHHHLISLYSLFLPMADTAHTHTAQDIAAAREIRVFLSSTFRDFRV